MTKIINHRLIEAKSEEELLTYLDEIEAYFLSMGMREQETEMVNSNPSCNMILGQEMRVYDVTSLSLATFYMKTVALRTYLEQAGTISKSKHKNWIEVLNFPVDK